MFPSAMALSRTANRHVPILNTSLTVPAVDGIGLTVHPDRCWGAVQYIASMETSKAQHATVIVPNARRFHPLPVLGQVARIPKGNSGVAIDQHQMRTSPHPPVTGMAHGIKSATLNADIERHMGLRATPKSR